MPAHPRTHPVAPVTEHCPNTLHSVLNKFKLKLAAFRENHIDVLTAFSLEDQLDGLINLKSVSMCTLDVVVCTDSALQRPTPQCPPAPHTFRSAWARHDVAPALACLAPAQLERRLAHDTLHFFQATSTTTCVLAESAEWHDPQPTLARLVLETVELVEADSFASMNNESQRPRTQLMPLFRFGPGHGAC